MSTRQAFRVYFTHLFNSAIDDGELNLTDEQVAALVQKIENDPDFIEPLQEFVVEQIQYGYLED